MKYNLNHHPRCIILLLACLGLPLAALASDTGSVLPNGNTADGSGVLFSRTTGIANSGFGFQSLYHDTTGSYNTATGYRALFNDTTGYSNTADGYEALYSDTTGIRNTAVGNGTLLHNNASFNTAIGWAALFGNTSGTANTATGYQALYSNTAYDNTATGYQALYSSTTGCCNTANGVSALYGNTTGFQNAANGYQALYSNTEGFGNTATGGNALDNNTTGAGSTADGVGALHKNTTGGLNTASGSDALFNTTTGSFNIALGAGAGDDLTTGDNNIDIGNIGVAAEANTIRIGTEVGLSDGLGISHPAHTATYIAGISGQTASGGDAVYVTSDGKLGTITAVSSQRFKDEIKPMDKASEAILALKPVTFRYKKELDPEGIPQFGLVAEEVEKVAPDLVKRDRDGKLQTVRYDAVNAMLLNEFLKEHRKVEDLKKDFHRTVAEQQKEIKALRASLKEQASQIQKVSERLEMSKSAPRIVGNNQ